MKLFMTGQGKGDPLIQVAAKAGLTIYIAYHFHKFPISPWLAVA